MWFSIDLGLRHEQVQRGYEEMLRRGKSELLKASLTSYKPSIRQAGQLHILSLSVNNSLNSHWWPGRYRCNMKMWAYMGR